MQKIARVMPLPPGLLLYRGLGGTVNLPRSFYKTDANLCRGFAEWGFMSTTADRKARALASDLYVLASDLHVLTSDLYVLTSDLCVLAGCGFMSTAADRKARASARARDGGAVWARASTGLRIGALRVRLPLKTAPGAWRALARQARASAVKVRPGSANPPPGSRQRRAGSLRRL